MLSRRMSDTIDLDSFTSHSDALTRRSISIFSRRGVNTDDHLGFSIMRGLPLAFRSSFDKPAPRRQSVKPKKSKGTILNAVPQKTGEQSPPTTLLLSPAVYARTVKESSPLEFACTTAVHEATTLKETQATIIAEKKGSPKKHSKAKTSIERIGVWVDGVIHWESGQQPFVRHSEEMESRSTLVQSRSRAQSDESGRRSSSRPSLTVVIPHATLLSREQSIAALKRPATSHGSPRRQRSAAHETAYPVRDVSPLTDEGSRRAGFSRSVSVLSPCQQSRTTSSASKRQDPSRSSSTTSSAIKDEDSEYSKHSSNTSVDASTQVTKRLTTIRRQMSASAIFSIVNPTVAATIDEYTPITRSYMDKPLPPTPPMSDKMRLNPMPPSLRAVSPPPKRPQTARSGSREPRPLLHKAQSFQDQSIRPIKSMNQLDAFDQEFMKTSPYVPDEEDSEDDSVTLSQAEVDLQEHLGRMSKHIPKIDGLTVKKEAGLGIIDVPSPVTSRLSVILMQPPSRAPTIPRKNHRREQRRSLTEEAFESVVAKIQLRRLSDPSSLLSDTLDAPPADWWIKHCLSRSVSTAELPKLEGFAEFIDRNDKLVEEVAIDDGLIVVSGPIVMRPEQQRAAVSAATQEAAEGVLVKILAFLTSIEDLMNAILINRGMFRVYRENERRLVRIVAKNESAPGCELREWLRPARNINQDDDDITIVEQSPASYVQAWKRDLKTIDRLKKMIVTECQSFIRKDTVAAMSDRSNAQAQRVTDAFWRIWTFCTIFGSQKGRDEDLTGQLDWLKGGRLANNLDCAATVNTNFDFDVGSILLNAPEYFGQGNGDGLTADQLYDITEIWTCMASLLQGYLGRVDQARDHGIYQNCNIDKCDIEKEEYMLEEWIAWIVTLGPTVVLELAEYASDHSSAGFALAQENGWTNWSPPTLTTSRVTFLKEPVARLYEERVTAANTKAQNAREQAEKEISRRRIQAHAQEIRARRQDSAFKRVPLVDMSMERPMSIMSTLSGSGGVSLTPRFPPRNMTLPPLPAAVHPALRSMPAISPASATMLQQAMLSTSMTSTLSPSMSGNVAMTKHQSAQPVRQALRAFNGVGVGTVELAVERIMGMGFTAAEATKALKTTDTGDGLRVDRAVDWLLRTRTPAATVDWTGS